MMLKSNPLMFTAALTAIFVVATAAPAFADTQWQKDHPRREQVNKRLANQNARIHNERKEGEITGQQAQALHQQDHQIRQEERSMASQNGGHLTGQEQKTLNQQQNGVSQQIGH